MTERPRVCLLRTAVPYATFDALNTSCEQMCDWVDQFDRVRMTLWCDLRLGPGRNDPPFERAMAGYRVRMQQGFLRVAVVVATPIGRLQVQRYASDDGITLRAFLTEAEAHTYLDGAT